MPKKTSQPVLDREPQASVWCRVCCTNHSRRARCPGPLLESGPEVEGWKVTVQTSRGFQAYGVLLAPSGHRWRARILTYPNVLWLVPGGNGALKFAAKTAEEAERRARDFIRQHCASRGYMMRDEVALADGGGVPQTFARPRNGDQLTRFRRTLPLRFGEERPTIPGVTRDLSLGGLFVVTEHPMACALMVGIVLQLEHCTVPLRAQVVWNRHVPGDGQPTGMGVLLHSPPQVYVRYVRALG